MVNYDLDIFPRDGESPELYEQRFLEAMLAADWSGRFRAESTRFCALRAELAATTDPDRIRALEERLFGSHVISLGSCALGQWRDGILAERQQFEADFGSL